MFWRNKIHWHGSVPRSVQMTLCFVWRFMFWRNKIHWHGSVPRSVWHARLNSLCNFASQTWFHTQFSHSFLRLNTALRRATMSGLWGVASLSLTCAEHLSLWSGQGCDNWYIVLAVLAHFSLGGICYVFCIVLALFWIRSAICLLVFFSKHHQCWLMVQEIPLSNVAVFLI